VPLKPLADEAPDDKRPVESRPASSSTLNRKLKRTQQPEARPSRTSAANHVTWSSVGARSVIVAAAVATNLLTRYFLSMHIGQPCTRSSSLARCCACSCC